MPYEEALLVKLAGEIADANGREFDLSTSTRRGRDVDRSRSAAPRPINHGFLAVASEVAGDVDPLEQLDRAVLGQARLLVVVARVLLARQGRSLIGDDAVVARIRVEQLADALVGTSPRVGTSRRVVHRRTDAQVHFERFTVDELELRRRRRVLCGLERPGHVDGECGRQLVRQILEELELRHAVVDARPQIDRDELAGLRRH